MNKAQLIVTDFVVSENGDSFNILFEKPVSLEEVTKTMANELELFKGEIADYQIKEKEAIVGIIDYWLAERKLSPDMIVSPLASREQATSPVDSYSVKENNLSGHLTRFYQFLEARFG